MGDQLEAFRSTVDFELLCLPAKLSPTRYLPSARNEPTAIRSRAFAHRRRAAGERVAPTLAQPGGRALLIMALGVVLALIVLAQIVLLLVQ